MPAFNKFTRLKAGVNQAVVKNTTSLAGVYTVNFTNQGSTSAQIRLAVSSNQLSPNSGEWIEWNTTITSSNSYERTGILLNSGDYMIVYSSSSSVVAQSWGFAQEPVSLSDDIVVQQFASSFTSALSQPTTATQFPYMRATAVYNATWVAVGSNTYSSTTSANSWQASSSSDGITWATPVSISAGGILGYFTHVAVNGSGLFVAVGAETASGTAYYSTSTDGVTWTALTRLGAVGALMYKPRIACNTAGRFMVVGYSTSFSNVYGTYSTSTDGTTWTTPATIETNNYCYVQDITTYGTTFVCVGYGSDNYSRYNTYSGSWGFFSIYNLTAGPAAFAVASNPAGTVTVSVGSSSGTPVYSVNYNNWNTLTGGPTMSGNQNMYLIYSSYLSKFVWVGYSSTGVAWYTTSANGSTWSTVAFVPTGVSSTFYVSGITINSQGAITLVGPSATSGNALSLSAQGLAAS
jgi:hypothetical protein